MRIAHLSDVHVSRLGATLTQSRGLIREAGDGWEPIQDSDGWRIEMQRAAGRTFQRLDHFRLVDDEGVVLETIKVKGQSEGAVIDELVHSMQVRKRSSAASLAEDLPDAAELKSLLAENPANNNLRFCAVAAQLLELDPEYVLITGDLTDDAVGFELFETALATFVADRRLVVIPGNHDIYASPPLVTTKALRKTVAEKRRLWGAFAQRIGQPMATSFIRDLGEGVVLACLDSAHPPNIPGSASGEVLAHELEQLAGAFDARGDDSVRICCLHHHIANPPADVIGSTPIQAGMKLRNAKRVMDTLNALGFQAVLNGHRHLGYRFHPAHSPLFLAAPSATMGCRSGHAPYFWMIDVDADGIHKASEVPVALHL